MGVGVEKSTKWNKISVRLTLSFDRGVCADMVIRQNLLTLHFSCGDIVFKTGLLRPKFSQCGDKGFKE